MRMVYCTFSIIGFHYFKDAPANVGYLKYEHRHEFKFKVSVEVSHDNREIEFHTLSRDCSDILINKTEIPITINGEWCFGNMSCEMIADMLMNLLLAIPVYNTMLEEDGFNNKERQIIIDVSEDGECGGTVSRL